MSKFRIGLVGLVLLVITTLFGVVSMTSASATGDDEPECVPSDAWIEFVNHPELAHQETVFDHWQRYSWTGGPHTGEDAPAFPGPDWQPNVEGDPHGIGIEGSYFVDHGNSGNGDWFYLESVEKEITVVDEEAWFEAIAHPAVTCEEEYPEWCYEGQVLIDHVCHPCDVINEVTGECDEWIDYECGEGQIPSGGDGCYACEDFVESSGVCLDDVPVLHDGDPKSDLGGDELFETTECLGGALVIKQIDSDGNTLSSSTENSSPECKQVDKHGETFREEGL